MEIKIEKNVPIPPKSAGTAKWIELAKQMEVGDSVFLERQKSKGQHSFVIAMRRMGIQCTFRTLSNGIRVWRTK